MLGIAIRVAQRMGIDTEAINAGYSVLEAELVCEVVFPSVVADLL